MRHSKILERDQQGGIVGTRTAFTAQLLLLIVCSTCFTVKVLEVELLKRLHQKGNIYVG